jgi:arsenite oxidase small subunit
MRFTLNHTRRQLLFLSSSTPTVAPSRVRVATLATLSEGVPLDFTYPEAGHDAFAIKLGAIAEGGVGPGRDVVAFLRACPHMGCLLSEVDALAATLGPCACHFSLFNLKRGGTQIYGRATQNLVRVLLQVVHEEGEAVIYAYGLNGLPYGEALTSRQALSREGAP